MAPEPIEFQIVQNLQTALQAIATASGYHFDVAGTAVKLDPNQDLESLIAPGGARPFIVIELAPEAWQYQPANQLLMTMPVTVYWVNDSDPTLDVSKMQAFFRGCADVERAVAADVTRGGLATDTRIVKRELSKDIDGAQVWAVVDLEISLYRTYGEPDA